MRHSLTPWPELPNPSRDETDFGIPGEAPGASGENGAFTGREGGRGDKEC
jgi:hypothetical protein